MRKEDIKRSFDNIEPSELSTQKMLNRILSHNNEGSKISLIKFMYIKKAIPALALTVVMVGSLVTYSLTQRGDNNQFPPGEGAVVDSDLAREDGCMPVMDQFQIDNRHYIFISQEEIAQLNLPAAIEQSHIGEKIATIKTSVDPNLIDCDVYKYLPAGGESIVVVKKDGEYKLFKFLSFESYNNNQDEDTQAYLKLYGINNANDIAKIQFISRTEEAKLTGEMDIKGEITEPGKIQEFYNYYSVIKDSSDKYFEKLFNYRKDLTNESTSRPKEIAPDSSSQTPADLPPDYAPEPRTDLPQPTPKPDEPANANDLPGSIAPSDQGGSTEPSPGSVGNALFDAVTVRIFNQNGIYFDAEYYPNIGFISRHEVNDNFADFLADYIN